MVECITSENMQKYSVIKLFADFLTPFPPPNLYFLSSIPLVAKHPVSVLQEICSKKHWGPPSYDLVESSGPSHLMTFLYSVSRVVFVTYLYIYSAMLHSLSLPLLHYMMNYYLVSFCFRLQSVLKRSPDD